MSNSGRGGEHFWCVRHHRVETAANRCSSADVLGPYASATEAEGALARVQERNEVLDAEDARWAGEDT